LGHGDGARPYIDLRRALRQQSLGAGCARFV
jgi:hypothetical protein